jgi:hypothetical protein
MHFLAWRRDLSTRKTAKTDNWFARAVAYLDAVEISPGRYAYRDGATRRYYVVTGTQLERLGRYIEAEIDQRATPWIKIPGGRGYSEWGADTVVFDMPEWWTPAVGLEMLSTQPWRSGRVHKLEKAEILMRWVKQHRDEPTTLLVECLKLPHDFRHCVLIDTVRSGDEKSARDAACDLAHEIPDTLFFDFGQAPRTAAPGGSRKKKAR